MKVFFRYCWHVKRYKYDEKMINLILIEIASFLEIRQRFVMSFGRKNKNSIAKFNANCCIHKQS